MEKPELNLAPWQSLQRCGVTIAPVADLRQLPRLRAQLQKSCADSPEFLPTAEKFVFGAFGGLGNPSSFHHPTVRRFRALCMQAGIRIFKQHVAEAKTVVCRQDPKLEMLWDRVCWRRAGTSTHSEALHRDQAEYALDDDEVFGGWMNFDSRPQYFHCVPGSHRGFRSARQARRNGEAGAGFCQMTKAESVRLRKGLRRVCVPPGHLVVFYQRIAHIVPDQKYREDSLRLFVGFRLTAGSESLQDLAAAASDVPNTEQLLADQGVPLLPSGQSCPMYPKMCKGLYPKMLLKWSRTTLIAACRVPDRLRGEKVRLAPRIMQSLKAMGLPMHRAYKREDAELMRPNRAWSLGGKRFALSQNPGRKRRKT